MNKIAAAVRAVSTWVARKNVTLTGVASFVVAMGVKYGDWSVDPADVLTGVGLFLALVSAQTVTSNARIGDGKIWGGYDGKDVPLAQVEIVEEFEVEGDVPPGG